MNSSCKRCASVSLVEEPKAGERTGVKVEIDQRAGFCAGVARAIHMAEEALAQGELVSVGPLLHNPQEVERLRRLGLRVVPQEEIEGADLEGLGARRVLVRSHGISPALRARLQNARLDIVDGTCPIVRRVQELVQSYCAQGYRVVIFGKKDHPEVRGLVGHCPEGAIVVNSVEEAEQLPVGVPTVLLAQTTASEQTFRQVERALRGRIPGLEVCNTTCRSVNRRQEEVAAFAREHQVVIFVGGRESSNSRQLFAACQRHNANSHWVEDEKELRGEWFSQARTVGVTGGASTPRWLLERVALTIEHVACASGHEDQIKRR